MKVYRFFIEDENGVLRSVAVGPAGGIFCLKYQQDAWTEAPSGVPDAWPFAYETEAIARRDGYALDLWECETRGTRPVYGWAGYFDQEHLLWWYDHPGELESNGRAPCLGTVQCDGIKPLRRLL